jgi:putative inorganic carbon (HCO3(-)) transporter
MKTKEKINDFFTIKFLFQFSMILVLLGLTFSTALVEISFVLALFFYAWLIFKKEIELPHKDLPFMLLFSILAFLIFLLVSLFWSEYPRESVRGLFKILQAIMLFIMASKLLWDNHDSEKLITFFNILFLVIIFNAFVQYATGTDFIRGYAYTDSSAGRRVISSFKTYGHFANYLNFCILFFLFNFLNLKTINKKKILNMLLMILAVYFLFLTRSRGAWLALVSASFLILLLSRKWILLILMGVLVLSSFLMLPRHMLIHLDTNLKEQSVNERVELWNRAIDVIRAKPLTGTGINTYSQSHQKYTRSKTGNVKDYYAHNGYLQSVAEFGIPGAFLYLSFLFFLIYYPVRFSLFSKGEPRGYVICWIGGPLAFLSFSMVDTVMHNSTSLLLFYFFSGIAYSALRQTKDENL